jgi:two-component system alkaline phosphatase synthesis response regulator PhoP
MAKRILLIDDEQDVLDLLKYNLEAEGYEIIAAKDALRGLKLAQSGPDLIIFEAMLPNKEKGWEFICQLRQTENTRHIPLVCLTTKEDGIETVCEPECGVDDYLVKPISVRQLLARVKTLLRN